MSSVCAYLLCFLPDKDFLAILSRQQHTSFITIGPHVTLCRFDMNEEKQNAFTDKISAIVNRSFEITTLSYAAFDRETLVVKTSLPQELLDLHNALVNIVKQYADDSFTNPSVTHSLYTGKSYNPHISVAKTTSAFERTQDLLDKTMRITNYALYRKEEGKWIERELFNLDQS